MKRETEFSSVTVVVEGLIGKKREQVQKIEQESSVELAGPLPHEIQPTLTFYTTLVTVTQLQISRIFLGKGNILKQLAKGRVGRASTANM